MTKEYTWLETARGVPRAVSNHVYNQLLLLVKQLPQCPTDIARATGLGCTLGYRRMVGHRLDTNAAWAGEAVEDDGGSGHHSSDSAQETAAALRTADGSDGHLYGWVFPQPCTRLNVQCFSRGKVLFEDVAIAMHQQHALAATTRELVNE